MLSLLLSLLTRQRANANANAYANTVAHTLRFKNSNIAVNAIDDIAVHCGVKTASNRIRHCHIRKK